MSLQEETTSLRTKEVDLKKQEREAAQGERGEGEKRQLQPVNPAPENPQSKAEPAAKTPIPERVDKVSRESYRSTVNKAETIGHKSCPSRGEGGPGHPFLCLFPTPHHTKKTNAEGLGLQV